MPVTTPVPATTDALVLTVLHAPPVGVPVSVVVEFSHTSIVPVIVPGNGFTNTGAVATQPVDSMYVMMLVPEATPVTTPVDDTTVATAVVPLLHVPPVVVLFSVVVIPTQTFVTPVMFAGNGFTVTSAVFVQPVPNE
jgi:hypothetical protein